MLADLVKAGTLPPVVDGDTGMVYAGELLRKAMKVVAALDPRIEMKVDIGRGHPILIGDRQDRAQDQVPVLADRDRHDWLDVERRPDAITAGSHPEVEVLLERHADQARHRIR